MIWLLLAEAAIELVPREIWKHPSVASRAGRLGKPPGKTLLDTSYHHSAMHGLDGKGRRGRPDITQLSLLCAMNTPLNIQHGLLRVAVHLPRPRECILHIDPTTRVPRSRARFDGLLSKILQTGKGTDLLRLEEAGIEQFLGRLDESDVHVLSPRGTRVTATGLGQALAPAAKERDVAVIVGAFQEGDFESPFLQEIPRENVHSIASIPLDAWTVVSRVILGIEEYLDPQ